MLCVGIDWGEKSHEVELMAEEGGRTLAHLKIDHGVDGMARLIGEIEKWESDASQVVVGIEATSGLLVNALVACGYQVYPINPKAATAYRSRHSIAGAKSDRQDARMLANLVRTDRHQHPPLQGDSDHAQEIKARARAHRRAGLQLRRLSNQLRSLLTEFYPALLPLLADDLRDALAILAIAPNPFVAKSLSFNKILSALRRAGRQRNLETKATQIQILLRQPQLTLGHRLTSAYADELTYLVRMLTTLTGELQTLEEHLTQAFRTHPDADLYRSLPGLAFVLGGRVLGESGDDPTRFPNGKSRQNYAGNPPITIASGKSRKIHRRVIRNRHLADATFLWARSAITASKGCRAYYDRFRSRGKTHNQALRSLANNLVGILHVCLRDRTLYDETKAWPQPPNLPFQEAA